MNFHAKSGICSSKNHWVMSTYVLFNFCNLFGISNGYYPYKLPCKIWSLRLKKWVSYAQFSVPCLWPTYMQQFRLAVRFWIDTFQIGSFPSPEDISGLRQPTKMVRPSKCSLVLTPWHISGHRYRRRKHPRIPCISIWVAHAQTAPDIFLLVHLIATCLLIGPSTSFKKMCQVDLLIAIPFVT